MITRADIVERANEWGLSEGVVEKDYVIGWLLWGIGSHPILSRYWAFEGGTCLKKCFFETYRFSEDLDFSVLPGSPQQAVTQVFDETEVRSLLDGVFEKVQETSGINFSVREFYLKPRDRGRALEGRVYYLGPTESTQVAKIKLDIGGTESVVRPTVLMPVHHSFPDELPGSATVRSYSFEELFAEKIRAMGQRGRPRDLYDIVNLYRHQGLGKAPELILAVLKEKCASKGIEVPTFSNVLGGDAREELESEWENMLEHQLPALPSVASYLDELENLFLWLDGELDVQALPAADLTDTVDESWRPPPLISTWGGAPVEGVRFAAANLLLVKMGYKDELRIVEPYSLRRSRAGDIILYARRPEEAIVKAYRVDRIQSIEVQRDVFEPLYPVEFTPGGAISVRPTRRRGGAPQARRTRVSTRGFSGATYAVECPLCAKVFRRKTMSTRLNAHKNPDGYPCFGRTGYPRSGR